MQCKRCSVDESTYRLAESQLVLSQDSSESQSRNAQDARGLRSEGRSRLSTGTRPPRNSHHRSAGARGPLKQHFDCSIAQLYSTFFSQEDGEDIQTELDRLRSSIGGGTDLWVLKASESNKGQVMKPLSEVAQQAPPRIFRTPKISSGDIMICQHTALIQQYFIICKAQKGI